MRRIGRFRRIVSSRVAVSLLGTTLIASTAAPLIAQRIAPSAVQRLDVAHVGLTSADTNIVRSRSHIDGAVHGALVGFGAGALTGAGLLGIAYLSTPRRNISASDEELPFAFLMVTVAGAVAGTVIGATLGGIVGR